MGGVQLLHWEIDMCSRYGIRPVTFTNTRNTVDFNTHALSTYGTPFVGSNLYKSSTFTPCVLVSNSPSLSYLSYLSSLSSLAMGFLWKHNLA